MDRNRRVRASAAVTVALRNVANADGPVSLDEMFAGAPDAEHMDKLSFAKDMLQAGLFEEREGGYVAKDPELLKTAAATDQGRRIAVRRAPKVHLDADKIRDQVQKTVLERGRKIVSPMVLMLHLGIGNYASDEQIEKFTDIVDEVNGLGLERFTVYNYEETEEDGSPGKRTYFRVPDMSLADALTADYGPDAWVMIKEPDVCRILSNEEKQQAKVARLVQERKEREETRQATLGDLTSKLRAFMRGRTEATTRDVVVEVMGLEPDKDGKLNAIAAAAMKSIGMKSERKPDPARPEKLRTVFVKYGEDEDDEQEDEQDEAAEQEAEEPEPAGDEQDDSELDDLVRSIVERQSVEEPDHGSPDPVSEAEPDLRVEKAGPPTQDPEEVGLPDGWRDSVRAYVQEETFVTMDELVFDVMSILPHELGFRLKGVLTRYMSSLGFGTDEWSSGKVPRRYFNRRRVQTPPAHEMSAVFSAFDRRLEEELGIKPSTSAPEWMDDEQRRDLSHLEHAVLLLSDGEHRPRRAIFPGHWDAEWQRQAIRKLIAEGVVEQQGQGVMRTYAGVGKIDEMLREGALVELFWERAADAGDEAPADPLQLSIEQLDVTVRSERVMQNAGIEKVIGLTEMTERDFLRRTGCGMKVVKDIRGALAQVGLSFLPEPEAARAPDDEGQTELEQLVAEMWELVQIQARQLAELKPKVKTLEEQVASLLSQIGEKKG